MWVYVRSNPNWFSQIIHRNSDLQTHVNCLNNKRNLNLSWRQRGMEDFYFVPHLMSWSSHFPSTIQLMTRSACLLLCSLAYLFRLISHCTPHALLDTRDEIYALFRKFGSSLPVNTVSHPRRLESQQNRCDKLKSRPVLITLIFVLRFT